MFVSQKINYMYNYVHVHVHCTCNHIQIRSVLFCWYVLFWYTKYNLFKWNKMNWIELNWIELNWEWWKDGVFIYLLTYYTVFNVTMLTVLYSFNLFWFFKFLNKILMWISELTWHGWRILYCCPALNQGTVYSSLSY